MLDILYSKFCAATRYADQNKRQKRWSESERTERVKQRLSKFTLKGDDLATGTTYIRVNVECLPKMVDRARARSRADVQKDANVRLKNRSKCIEEPAVRIDLLLILLLETEYNLHRDDSLLCALDLIGLGDRDLYFRVLKLGHGLA